MTIVIDLATAADIDWLDATDRHVDRDLITKKVQAKEILIAKDQDESVALLRWGMFWDLIPFMYLLWVIDSQRGQGIGRQIVTHWEQLMQAHGAEMVITSTQADESAQHFYRKLDYVDSGALFLPGDPTEIILIKRFA